MLDVGTGGGAPPRPSRALAGTGGRYGRVPPNVALARERPLLGVGGGGRGLAPRAPAVPKRRVDLILNRHWRTPARSPALFPGGVFSLSRWTAAAEDPHGPHARPLWPDAALAHEVSCLREAGLATPCRGVAGALTFTDIGAIVYYLRAVP